MSRGVIATAIVIGTFVGGAALAVAPYDFAFGAHGGPLPTGTITGMDALDPVSCRGCHAEVYAEWAGSMHARSFVDPIFQAELAQTADTTPCRTCHAPLAPVTATEGPVHDVGVACAACHVRGGEILSTRAPGAATPHRTRVVAELDSTRFCASCHDFRFPDLTATRAFSYDPDTLQQSTATEWARSGHARAGRSCVVCHMPAVAREGGREGGSHRLRSLEDEAFVRDALEVVARVRQTRTTTRLELRLVVKGAGHAVPTGDIFRALRVRARNDVGEAERTLRRNFAEQHTARGWVLADSYDDRVQPDEPKVVVLELPRSEGRIDYTLDILRLALPDAARRGLPEASIVVRVHDGRVVPARSAR